MVNTPIASERRSRARRSSAAWTRLGDDEPAVGVADVGRQLGAASRRVDARRSSRPRAPRHRAGTRTRARCRAARRRGTARHPRGAATTSARVLRTRARLPPTSRLGPRNATQRSCQKHAQPLSPQSCAGRHSSPLFVPRQSGAATTKRPAPEIGRRGSRRSSTPRRLPARHLPRYIMWRRLAAKAAAFRSADRLAQALRRVIRTDDVRADQAQARVSVPHVVGAGETYGRAVSDHRVRDADEHRRRVVAVVQQDRSGSRGRSRGRS